MTQKRHFDLELLERPRSERLAAFDEFTVAHRNLTKVTEELKDIIMDRTGPEFIFLIGPSGVGKTTMQSHVISSLLRLQMERMQADPGYIPFAWVEAAAHNSSFNWKDYWYACLSALREPLLNFKTGKVPSHPPIRSGDQIVASGRGNSSLNGRRSFENAAVERKLLALFVDEAHSMTYTSGSQDMVKHAEVIKSVTSRTGVVHVLVGTYKLLELSGHNGQLGRRSKPLHFAPYHANDPEDAKEFAKALKGLQQRLVLPQEPDLGPYVDYFLDNTLGCVGILKRWLYDTLASVTKREAQTIEFSDLEASKPSPGWLADIATEIGDSMGKLKDDASKLESALTKLRSMHKPPSGDGDAPPDASSDDAAPKRPTGGSKGRVGERRPTRDSVGGGRKKDAD